MKGGSISLGLFSLAAILSSLLLVHLSMVGVREPVSQADCLPTPRPTEPCDICEPNNSLSQACGPLAPGKRYQYFIRCTTKPDDDYYYIDLETPGTVTLDLTDIPPGADYDIYLYDENKTLKCYSNRGGNLPEHAECHLGSSGRYYVWVHPYAGCNESDPYVLTVAYPTPPPPPIPTTTPTPPCNVHIDDFGDSDPRNDLRKPSGWELDPPGCGTFGVEYNGFELQLNYDLTGPVECTARYTTTLSLGASPYKMLTFGILGSDRDELASTVIGLRDEVGHETRLKVGDFLNHVVTNTWEGVDLPLAAFATAVDTTQLDTLFVEMTDTAGASKGTIYLDSIRLERPLAPLTVDNFNDLADPNALGGGTGIYKDEDPGTILETTYIADGTYDNSPGSYIISYTLPSGGWALWETDLLGLDVSDYAFLTFYIKGANGGEKVNLYLADGGNRAAYVDMEDYAPIAIDWTPVRVPLQAFEGVALTDLTRVKLVFEWEPMTGTISLDDLRFVADTLLIDNFCDSDECNSLNNEMGLFTSSPFCTAAITPTLSCDGLRLDYDVTAGSDCVSGYWSQTRLDLNPYRTLAVKVRGQRCGQVAAISARTVPIPTDKIKLSGYLLDGITDQWQEARIPLAASFVITDWTRGDAYVIAFEAGQGASKGTTWWDDVAFETACAPLWVDNFNDEDNVNALLGLSKVFGWEAEIISTTSIIQACGDVGAGLVLTYAVPAGRFAGWETDLREVDLSGYDRLIFQVKGAAGAETFHIYLKDGDGSRRFVEIEKYAIPSTEWQTIVIGLQSFYGVDLTRIQAVQFVIEYEPADVEGTLFFDNIRFLPSADCSQIVRNLVYMPLIGKGYKPLALDPVWDFESCTEGWTHETYVDSQAVVAVVTSSLRSRWGNASLAMIVDLVGGDDNKSQGEAFVDVKHHPPSGVSAPINLECKPLSCWIYVPTCGLGDQAQPNLVQLFVKDASGKSEYGTPTRVVRNQWFEVGIRPSTLQPDGGHKDAGFDPSAIEHVGVRFKAGREGTTYRGKVYVDACGWQEIDPTAVVAVEACPPDKGGERVLPVVPRLEE
jgi:hypothetical protein